MEILRIRFESSHNVEISNEKERRSGVPFAYILSNETSFSSTGSSAFTKTELISYNK